VPKTVSEDLLGLARLRLRRPWRALAAELAREGDRS
jgi:hypothetical protein